MISDLAKRYNLNKFWIGGNELTDSEKWSWTDGSNFDFNLWAQGEPDILPGFQCIFVDTSTKSWYTQDCYKDLSYVCQIPADTYFSTPDGGHGTTGVAVSVVTQRGSTSGNGGSSGGGSSKTPTIYSSPAVPTTPENVSANPISVATPSQQPTTSIQGHTGSSSKFPTSNASLQSTTSATAKPQPPPTTASQGTVCEFGWVYFEPTHSCYKNTTYKYDLNGAEKVCTSFGAKLASVENAAEYAFFNQTMQYFWYWIGLCSNDNSKTWNWIDGKPLKFTKWCPNAPFQQASSCVMTNPKMYCFSNVVKSSSTYGMCKKPAIHLS
uniref:C-type lectin domain-containing protein n=1 Tax=Panagrolaimus sp. PS1159 TaxID=55785 RepID=A0AC35F5J7_9BILA